jgi:hypothetical protein
MAAAAAGEDNERARTSAINPAYSSCLLLLFQLAFESTAARITLRK